MDVRGYLSTTGGVPELDLLVTPEWNSDTAATAESLE